MPDGVDRSQYTRLPHLNREPSSAQNWPVWQHSVAAGLVPEDDRVPDTSNVGFFSGSEAEESVEEQPHRPTITQRLLSWRLPVAAAFSVVLLLRLVSATPWSPKLEANVEMPVQLSSKANKKPWTCGQKLDGIDLWTRQQDLELVPGIGSAADCQMRCFEEGACMAWSWGKHSATPGLAHVCFLKQLEQAETPVMKHKSFMVSGSLPCQMQDIREPGSLYCFALMMPTGYELGLLQMQHAEGLSLFDCEGYGIYSNQRIEVAPGVFSHVVDSDLKCSFGGEFGTALNLEIFLVVWKKVVSNKEYSQYDWTVKVDPDAVFFPDRLRDILPHHRPDKPGGVYLNNCKFGMHGPLEVFSKNAVETWFKAQEACSKHFWKLCSGSCNWGEDMFIDQCLWKVFHIQRDSDWSLLAEDHCPPDPKHAAEWQTCSHGHVAYHPYKTIDSYHLCVSRAKAATTSTMTTTSTTLTTSTTTKTITTTATSHSNASARGSLRTGRSKAKLKPQDDDMVIFDEERELFQLKCPVPDNNVDYDIHNTAELSLDHIPTPEMCCAFCHGIPTCKAWVWKIDPNMTGCQYRCWVLDAVPPEHKRRTRVGVVSGMPPSRPHLKLDNAQELDDEARVCSTFCFELILPTSYEQTFVSMQRELHTSIFQCTRHAVYSNMSLEVAPGLVTRVVDSDLTCRKGGDSFTALNTWIFIAVWKKVIADGFWRSTKWTVKVDADAIFLPSRLCKVLKDHKDAGYLNNCEYGLHGPIEVLSYKAVNVLAIDYEASEKKDVPYLCVKKLSFGLWGEDIFLDQCLSKVHNVSSELDTRLLCEANCNCPNWYWCTNGTDRVSYHPFKRDDMYKQCMANALYTDLPRLDEL